ncbi:hypothetical protein CO641_02420 [Lysobacteraceae bacterium NML91-0213]|nr:hypothetical protein CO641_02420 [Xanthomonadaceae bacterium NML91-0213]
MAAPQVRQFAGDFRVWRLEGGQMVPAIPEPTDPYGNQPIETNAFSFGYEAGDEVVVNSKRRGARFNQPLYSDQLPGATSLSIQLQEMPTLILAAVLRGVAVRDSMAAGAVTDEAMVMPADGKPLQLPHKYVSDLVISKGGSALEAGTDYSNAADVLRRGQVLATGAGLEPGDAITVSYAYPQLDATRIQGGHVPIQSFYITGDMEDRISGDEGELTVFEARLGVEDDIDWLSAEPLSPTLTGNLLVPPGAPAPYTFDVYRRTT